MSILFAMAQPARTGMALGCFCLLSAFYSACSSEITSNKTTDSSMAGVLAETRKRVEKAGNPFASEAKLRSIDSLLALATDPAEQLKFKVQKAGVLLENGRENEAVALYEELKPMLTQTPAAAVEFYLDLGTAYLRLAERNSCIAGHNADACTLPFRGQGIHQDKAPARKAIEAFGQVLAIDAANLDARWLFNIAYMVVGEYPKGVPAEHLIPGLDAEGEKINPFISMAPDLGIMTNNCSGGSIVEDLNNDGLLDIVTSSFELSEHLYLYVNRGDGSFTDATVASGLNQIAGGLNLTTTDYNNDGFIDLLVLRGAWQGVTGAFGEQPNSLLRNNGDGTFTDVTVEAGLLSFRPTQTATWNDFNNDGWLDVFIANESSVSFDQYPCELYINNKNGTFTDMAAAYGVNFGAFIKGVTSCDYDNDGWVDLFFSTMNGEKMLLKNKGLFQDKLVFENVTEKAGFAREKYRSFPTWFFDYDNDGWFDIFVCNYEYSRTLAHYFAREALTPGKEATGKPRIYRNNGNGTFTNVSDALGLHQPAFAMGANFGDINNDGWLDMYLATGNPNFRSLIPNKLFKNMQGKRFADVTNSSRTGNLQKGHGVSFGDLDNDFDQDLHVEMGGAYKGDNYPSLFYLNPGQPEQNNAVYLKLEGTTSNKAAIGARVAVVFKENGKTRTVYRDVTSGGSFGCSPLRLEIGVGKATAIDEVVVYWPASKKQQTFKSLKSNQLYRIREADDQARLQPVRQVVFKHADGRIPMCVPAAP